MFEQLKKIIEEISNGNDRGEKITLVGATKTVPADTINLAVKSGLKIVAENRVQEFLEKKDDIIGVEQQFIGRLQTNKVKYLVGKVSLIQSVDSLHLAEKINEVAEKKGLIQNVLAEINVGGELTKGGFSLLEAESCIKDILKLPFVKIKGLMTILPKTDEQEIKKKLCLQMRNFYDNLIKDGFDFSVLSMGMSGDYKTAINCGSNMIRLGSLIFGERR